LTPPRLVFVGGTGRSGTHVIARLLGNHPAFAHVPIESRFHCHGPKGFPDLLGGRVALSDFLWKLREFWWHRVRKEDDQPRGLYMVMPRRRFDDAVGSFESAFHADPVGACRALYLDLLWPVAEELGRPGLVEMSSHNVREIQTLSRLFPEARFIHVFRDGRDTASSITTMTWGPGTLPRALDWWADRMRAIENGVRSDEDGARFVVPASRLHPVLLDDLVERDREAEYARLRSFLGVDDDPAMRDFFDNRMGPGAAHRGRWRQSVGRIGAARVDRKYRRLLTALDREGHHAAPRLIAACES
jgi:sulfotransferase family protein